MCNKLIVLCVALVVVGLNVQASAAKIVYVDATDSNASYTGNTTLASGGAWTASSSRSGTDGLWAKRVDSRYHLGNPNPLGEESVYEANGGTDGNPNDEDVPMLVTTVSVPANLQGKTLNVYAFFWTTYDSYWRIRASLTPPAPGHVMPLFYEDTPGLEYEQPPLGPNNGQALFAGEGFEFYGTVMTISVNRMLYIADLGTTTAGATLSVYVDSDNGISHTFPPLTSTWNARTWYDGVGYTPEPTTVALLGLGGLALLRRKRAN
jgi:hypothetical protein